VSYKFINPLADTFKSHLIFPTVVATADNQIIPRDEHEIILNSEFIVNSQYGAFPTSKNKYILDTVPTLKLWIQNQVNRYATEIMGSGKLRFTQSWAIKHENQPHHIYTHTHSNSIISGSYYIDAPKGCEPLTLMKPFAGVSGPIIEYEKNFHDKPWLYEQMKYRAYTGRLILFPSNLSHGVLGQQTTTKRRCVLAFNTWFTDPIGTEEALTYLE
jgi:uncharacterized protein (TIGR02466 family)